MMKRLHAGTHAKATGGERIFHHAQLPLHDETHGMVIQGTAKHLPRILELMEKGKNEGMLKERSTREILRDVRRGNCFLYEKNGLVVGMVFLVVYDQRMAEMRSIYVEDVQRRNGAGPALVKRALARGKELSIESIMIITKKGNEEWFHRQGFSNEAHGFRVAMFAKTDT